MYLVSESGFNSAGSSATAVAASVTMCRGGEQNAGEW